MRKAFLKDCLAALQSIAAALPERISPEKRLAVAGDIVLRLIFLRFAEDIGLESGTLSQLRRSCTPLVGSPAISPEPVMRLLDPQKEQSDPPDSVLPTLSPQSILSESEVASLSLPEDALRSLLCEGGILQRYSFSAEEQLLDDRTTLGPIVLADLVEATGGARRSRGAYYTPPEVVDFSVREALAYRLEGFKKTIVSGDASGLSGARRSELACLLKSLTVLDPACGGGAFLVGVFKVFWDLGLALYDSGVLREPLLYGADIDPRAAGVTRMRLWLAATSRGVPTDPRTIADRIRQADTLTCPSPWDERQTWDLVLTNPPYGVKVATEIRNRLFHPEKDGHQSRDAYGLFLARIPRLLSEGGIATLVVADTWRTITSHLPLRRRLLSETQLLHVIELPDRVFDATVGAEIVTMRNSVPERPQNLQVADLRGSCGASLSRLLEPLHHGVDQVVPDQSLCVYSYPQSLCRKHPRHPIFVALPGLFRLVIDPALEHLGSVAEVRHGLTTGNTRRFIYKRPGAGGPYPLADPSLILRPEDLATIQDDHERQHGFDPATFNGRYLVPYDKGGGSRSADGWLPCYNVPTDYFIDWRAESVAAMKLLPGFRHDGRAFYFRSGVTFSHTGCYAPTFRFGSGGVFDTAGSTLFPRSGSLHLLLALLNSRVVRYLFKNYLNHSVNTSENPLKEIPLPPVDPQSAQALTELVMEIARKQQEDRYYPFHRHEQLEIDRLIYDLYGLSTQEIGEIESWFRRRYPALTGNQ